MIDTTLITTDALAAQLGGAAVIVDCRYDLKDENWGLTQYRAGHVPGAVYVSLSHDLSSHPDGRNGRHPLPAIDELARTFGRLGISPSTQVYAYDQDSGMYASRLWWTLRYAGHDAVAVVDGGWAKWLREGRPSAQGDERRTPATFTPSVRASMYRDLAAIEHSLGDPRIRLLDARAAERFEGRVEPLDRVAGHIPGAGNHSYRDNLAADGTMLPADTLRAQFAASLAGHAPQDAVMYCGSGVSACHNLLAMAYAGLDVPPLYVGSWSEWSSDPARPVETGPERRR